MPVKTVGVIGCGLMGSGIAQVSAVAGYATIVREVDEPSLQRGLGRIRTFLDAGVSKGKMAPAARDQTLANLSGTTTVDALANCDLIVEAVIEHLDEKKRIYQSLESILKS